MATDGTTSVGTWNYPTQMRFGVYRIRELPEACRELGFERPLLVTDPVLAALPLVRDTLAILEQAGMKAGLFSDVQPNPVGENITAGVEAFVTGGHDGVVAFGGGSALDAAKTIAMMVGQTRPLWDYEDQADWWTRIDEAGMRPLVAVPTTSGTGSEVGRASVIVDAAERKKKIIFHPKMLPARVICDPALTAGMPPKLTGAVGMDALSHNLEAFCASGYHPMADGIALEGLRRIARALRRACADGSDLDARAEMMAASSMGATAFQKGLGAMHAVGHAVGGRFDVHHGTTVAVMMPYVLRMNRPAIEERLVRLARYLEVGDSFEALLDWVLALRRDVGIPPTLAHLGVGPGDVDELAVHARVDPTAATNPVELSEQNVRELIQAALAG